VAFGGGTFFLGNNASAESQRERKIVVFKERVEQQSEVQNRIVERYRAGRVKELRSVRAHVLELSASDARALAADADVLRVEDDVILSIQAWPQRRVSAQAQTLPWGIDRVDAEQVWPTGNVGDPIKVAVVDTGISTSHPDLKANVKGGYNAIRPSRGWNDDNGHGSHVAGIIAALNNTQGVVGVGPAIDLYAVKVLNAGGSGYTSDVIEGIDWAVQHGAQVINLSLGSSQGTQSLHDAVTAARSAGVVVVAAAGNSGGAVIYPAAYPEVIAVSATDQNNNLASFSSRGPEVDLAAPGVSVYSTYKSKSYATLSGTSMASPHVAGTAALVLNTAVGSYDQNGNGTWDPTEIQAKLQTTATDLGAPGFDTLFGWGLINAFAAAQ
ncbi:MAG: S8 family peptidase, partial [Patescibacteria group bacterium]